MGNRDIPQTEQRPTQNGNELNDHRATNPPANDNRLPRDTSNSTTAEPHARTINTPPPSHKTTGPRTTTRADQITKKSKCNKLIDDEPGTHEHDGGRGPTATKRQTETRQNNSIPMIAHTTCKMKANI